MIKYKCIFEFRKHKKLEITSARFTDFIDGFWITKEWLFTCEYQKQKFWIPAHKIQYIEKYEEI